MSLGALHWHTAPDCFRCGVMIIMIMMMIIMMMMIGGSDGAGQSPVCPQQGVRP